LNVRPNVALALGVALALASPASAADFPHFLAQEIDPHVGNICYAVTTADVDGNGKPDVVAVSEDSVVWFANPSWEKSTLIKNVTARDNVCIQPHDVDGDGAIDFAVGAGWQPTNTQTGGTLQWIRRSGAVSNPWVVYPLNSEPTLHRIRWGDVQGTGRKQLVVAPLQGRGTKGPNWGDGQGVRILVFSVPADPYRHAWPVEVADSSLHTVHNLQVTDFDGDGRQDVVVAAWEGVFVLRREPKATWSKKQIGAGNQETSPFKGASEVKVGRLADGSRYVATIEPWHGHQVVAYTPPKEGDALWDRKVIDEPVQWGHAVWCANLDADEDQELIIGQRDKSTDPNRKPAGPGILIYDPTAGSAPLRFERHVLDDGGIGTEDLVVADLNGDGREDIIAGGRSTHNVRIYWNQGTSRPKPAATPAP
jgi:hypothetical protein